MHLSFADVRRAAFLNTEENFGCAIPPVHVTLTEIDRHAVQAWSQTWAGLHPSGHGAWHWARIAARYCRSPRNFHVALWADDILCGLAVGTVPRRRDRLTLEYMARRQNAPNPLAGAITGIIVTAGVYYCQGLRIPRFELQNPAPGLVGRYQAAGFTLAYNRGMNQYLAQDIH